MSGIGRAKMPIRERINTLEIYCRLSHNPLLKDSSKEDILKVKIILINSLYHPRILGGAERLVQLLAESLLNAGHEPIVISTKPTPGVDVNYVNDVKVYYVGLKNIYWAFHRSKRNPFLGILVWHAIDSYNPSMASAVGAILERERPDLVHTNNLRGFSVAIWNEVRKRGLICVHTLMDFYLLCPRSTFYRNNNICESQCSSCKLYSISRKRASAIPHGVVGVSGHTLRAHLDRGYFKSAVSEVIHGGIKATGGFQPRKTETRKTVRFGFLGALTPQKGVELLLQSARELPQSAFELRIAGAGTTEYEAQLKSKSNILRNVSYCGFVRTEEFLSEIDVLVVPSLWHEPQGIVVAEAFSAGVPVIASARGGIPEVVENGTTGFLFEPNDAGSLTDAMKRFIQNPALLEQCSIKATRKARYLTSGRMTTEYLAFYNKVMNSDR
jgi:glycosyltransferase involved in cell wall biosynthesis